MVMRNQHSGDRPREKLKYKGPTALSDFELLQALIGSGNKQADVAKIAKDTKSVLQKNGPDVSYNQLEAITGLGEAKISELLSAFELSKRYLINPEMPVISTAKDVAELVNGIKDKKQEHFIAITLDGANRVIAKRTITIGTLTASLVHPREVFADAITDHAAGVIVAHNHPSGSLTPSKSDLEITQRLIESGELLGIKLLDHIIVSKTGHSNITIN